jgi:hypothetical protein
VTDNAHMVPFFHSLKAEIVHGRVFSQDSQVLAALRSHPAVLQSQKNPPIPELRVTSEV